MPADDERDGGENAHGVQTQCAVASVVVVSVDLEERDDAGNSDQGGEYEEWEALFRLVGRVGNDH